MTEPRFADHDRMMQLIEQLTPETRARIAGRLDDRFHEITGAPRGNGCCGLTEQAHRDELLRQARLKVALPGHDSATPVAEHSRITDRLAREIAFDDLCRAVANGEDNRAESVIDLLRSEL